MSWVFRRRISLVGSSRLNCPDGELGLLDSEKETVTLSSGLADVSISNSDVLFLSGSGYETEMEASLESRKWKGWVGFALVGQAIGADFGERIDPGGFTREALRLQSESLGATVLNGNESCHVYEAYSSPIFLGIGAESIIARKGTGGFKESIDALVLGGEEISSRAEIACSLYSIAQATRDIDAKFVVLSAAIEAFIEPKPMPKRFQDAVRSLHSQAKRLDLPEAERNSILGRINSFKDESIMQAGLRLVREFDGGEGLVYGGEAVETFFKKCYEIRSRIVHASYPRVEAKQVRTRVYELNRFVRDLILKIS